MSFAATLGLAALCLLTAFLFADRRRRASWESYRERPPHEDESDLLWTENPTTVGEPGHETLEVAWQRLFGEPEPLIPTGTWTAEFRLYPAERLAVRRHDGTGRIYGTLPQKKRAAP